MGNCHSAMDEKEDSEIIEYKKTATLNVTRRNSIGDSFSTNRITFVNTSPIKQKSIRLSLGIKRIKISGCIIPGLEPKQNIEKECQDNYTILFEENYQSSALFALFDGHGKEGKKVTEFCIKFTEKFFKKNVKDLAESPQETLTRLLHKCDEKLKRSKIHTEMSGSTAIVIYLTDNSIHSASLGDSRAIIAVLSIEPIPVPEVHHNYYRKVTVARNLNPIPLTTDQKPNHENEYSRIIAAGGTVEQVTDSSGKPIGPYRV